MKPAGRPFGPILRLLGGAATLAMLAGGLLLPETALAREKNSAETALGEFSGKRPIPDPIRNRFFLKTNRFEIAPALGYVPNNSFADIYVGGAFLAYHFSERFSVEAALMYSPNSGASGVKGLTRTLLDIAYQGDPNTKFQQPIDRLQIASAFSARWAPVYGKINLIGEGVVNFDVYGTGGVGLLAISKDVATISEDYRNGTSDDPVYVEPQPQTQFSPALNLGAGINVFLSPSIALKLDARTLIFVGPEADYIVGDVDPTTGQPQILNTEVQTAFITTGGISIFVPKMKPRIFNF
jgi:outer membrane beta-barrel protein